MSMTDEIGPDLIARVRQALETSARKARTTTYSEIEAAVGAKFRQDQWRQVLDPIYEEQRARGEPDLTAIIVYASGELKGYPAYFSDGGDARSRRFNPNNSHQFERWTKEVDRVFSTFRS